MERLDGKVGWKGWMERLDGKVGWKGWMERLDGKVGEHSIPSATNQRISFS
jgi:hypothetical protein